MVSLEGGIIIRDLAVLSGLVVLVLIYLFLSQAIANPTAQANIHGSYVTSKFVGQINPFNFYTNKEYCSINSTDKKLAQIAPSENMPKSTSPIQQALDGTIPAENILQDNNISEANQESTGNVVPIVTNYFNISIQADNTTEALSFINESLSFINKSIYGVAHPNNEKEPDGGGSNKIYDTSKYNGNGPRPAVPPI